MARSELWLGLLLLAGCKASPPPPTPASAPSHDAGRPLIHDWAVPERQVMLKRARCTVPDGGLTVSVFDGVRVHDADCEAHPLFCATPAARDLVLTAVDAGRLKWPTPRSVTRSDPRGVFEVELDPSGLAMIECGDDVIFHAPSGLDMSFTDPTLELFPYHPPAPAGLHSNLLIVDPFRRTARTGSSAVLPFEAWVTALGEPLRTKAPTEGSFTNGEHGMGSLFDVAPSPRPREKKGATAAIRVEARGGLVPRELRLQLTAEDGGMTDWVSTRANGYDFDVSPGRYTARVLMPGANPASASLEVGDRAEVLIPLDPALGRSGLVVDAKGKGVAGATLELDGVVFGTTDAEGAFSIAPHDEPAPKLLRAWHASIGVSDATAASPRTVLRLLPRSAAHLKVLTPDGGVPLGAVRVIRGDGFDTTALRGGLVPLAGLAPGRHELLVLTREWGAEKLALEITDQTTEVEVRLGPKQSVSGVVTYKGKPIEGIRVEFVRSPPAVFGYDEDRTRTDAEGRFTLGRSLPSEATLRFDGKKSLKVKVPSAGHRIELVP